MSYMRLAKKLSSSTCTPDLTPAVLQGGAGCTLQCGEISRRSIKVHNTRSKTTCDRLDESRTGVRERTKDWQTRTPSFSLARTKFKPNSGWLRYGSVHQAIVGAHSIMSSESNRGKATVRTSDRLFEKEVPTWLLSLAPRDARQREAAAPLCVSS